MTQPATEQDWSAANNLAGMQAPPPEPQKPDLTPPDTYKGGAPAGSILATPRQATAETLNSLERKKDLTEKQGQIAEGEGNDLAKAYDAKEAEDLQRSQDFDAAIKQAAARHEADHQRTVDAFNAYQQAGPLRDPSSQFWQDKGAGAKTLAAFAAFASGLGAGLQGQGGNPFLGYLNQQFQQNFAAHKENLDALYQKQVAAGKLSDDSESYAKFMQDAKLHAFDLAAEHWKSKLESIKNGALGQNQRALAGQSSEDITQQQIAMRRAQAQQEAMAQANALAAYRARMKEVQTSYEDAYKSNLSAGMGEEQSRQAAAKFVEGKGYDRSLIAPIAESNGGQYNAKTGQYEYQEITPKQNADTLIPTVDPVSGKALKPEEREKLAALKVTLPDGTVRLANNAEDQKKVQQEITAHQTVGAFRDKLNGPNGWLAKMASGNLSSQDVGEWEGARKAAIESYKALSGAEGNTGIGTARLLGEDEFPEPPSITGNALVPSFLRTAEVKKYTGQVKNMDNLIDRTQESIDRRLRPAAGQAAAPKPTAYVPKSFKPAGT